MAKKAAVCLAVFLLLLIGAIYLDRSLAGGPKTDPESRVMSDGDRVFAPREYVKIIRME